MFVANMAFNARVSDPSLGGTYMTLLNTLSNLGGVWTTTAALWFVDVLSWKTCTGAKTADVSCSSKLNEKVWVVVSLNFTELIANFITQSGRKLQAYFAVYKHSSL